MAFRGLASSLKAFAFRAPFFLVWSKITLTMTNHDSLAAFGETKKEAQQVLI
tara:strand:+ start:468 stop:623 length:156 start_codon:yes stop_codon:yes gene_type:complete